MASTFGGISLCSVGLYNSQTNLYTANVNINNAGTTGYSRQIVNQNPGYTTTMSNGVVAVGINPDAVNIEQSRSTYLDQRYWSEQPALGEWETKTNILSQMESILSELDDTGITAGLDALNQSLETLTTQPQSVAAKTAVIQDITALCDTLNSSAQQLYDLQTSVENDIVFTVDQINQKTAAIANLNDEILQLELSGGNASALEDQRNLLIDELSQLTDISVMETTLGTTSDGQAIIGYTIKSGNSLLVNEGTSHALETTESVSDDGIRIVSINWTESGQDYTPNSGSLKATLDLMNGDGTSGNYKGIPYFMNDLDEFAYTLVTEMNGIHEAGYGEENVTGLSLFDPTATSAINIQISSELIEHPEQLALSSNPDEAGNTENLFSLIECLNDTTTFGEGSFNDYINKLTTELGSDISYANNKLESATGLTMQIDLNRMSVSGVSIDEEMSSIVLQQQIYDATAKMMQMWNEIIDTTITQLGG